MKTSLALIIAILALSFSVMESSASVDAAEPEKIIIKFANDRGTLDILRERSFPGESLEDWQKRVDSYPEPRFKTAEERLKRRDGLKDEAAIRRIKEIRRILNETVIPEVEFQDESLDRALGFLGRSTGVPIINGEHQGVEKIRLTLTLKEIPAAELLRYILQLTHSRAEIVPAAILVAPWEGHVCCGKMAGREIPIYPDAMVRLLEKAGMKGNTLLKGSEKQLLEKLGFSFSPGTALVYSQESEGLYLRFPSDEDLLRFEAIVDEVSGRLEEAKKSLEQRRTERRVEELFEKRQELRELRFERIVINRCSLQRIRDELIKEPLGLNLAFARRDALSAERGSSANHVIQEDFSSRRVTLLQENVSVMEFLQELARQTGTELIVGERSIALVLPATVPAK